jgi:hypothetical protein
MHLTGIIMKSTRNLYNYHPKPLNCFHPGELKFVQINQARGFHHPARTRLTEAQALFVLKHGPAKDAVGGFMIRIAFPVYLHPEPGPADSAVAFDVIFCLGFLVFRHKITPESGFNRNV